MNLLTQAQELLIEKELPLFHASGVGETTSEERRNYLLGLFRDILGFIPIVDKAASVWSVIDTMKEWTQHRTKISDSIDRLGFIIGIAEIVRYMREEDIVDIRQLIDDRIAALKTCVALIASYKDRHDKLVDETEWLVKELRKPELSLPEDKSQ